MAYMGDPGPYDAHLREGRQVSHPPEAAQADHLEEELLQPPSEGVVQSTGQGVQISVRGRGRGGGRWGE